MEADFKSNKSYFNIYSLITIRVDCNYLKEQSETSFVAVIFHLGESSILVCHRLTL